MLVIGKTTCDCDFASKYAAYINIPSSFPISSVSSRLLLFNCDFGQNIDPPVRLGLIVKFKIMIITSVYVSQDQISSLF